MSRVIFSTFPGAHCSLATGRPKSTTSRTIFEMRSMHWRIMVSLARAWGSSTEVARTWTSEKSEARGLPISWAIPAASWPAEASRSARTSSSRASVSARFTSFSERMLSLSLLWFWISLTATSFTLAASLPYSAAPCRSMRRE